MRDNYLSQNKNLPRRQTHLLQLLHQNGMADEYEDNTK
jgi:hypothetical protein